jgi:hypothetical protein
MCRQCMLPSSWHPNSWYIWFCPEILCRTLFAMKWFGPKWCMIYQILINNLQIHVSIRCHYHTSVVRLYFALNLVHDSNSWLIENSPNIIYHNIFSSYT